MRFKTSALKESKHTDLVSCVAWMSPDDVISIGDDKKILKWNLVQSETKGSKFQLYKLFNNINKSSQCSCQLL